MCARAFLLQPNVPFQHTCAINIQTLKSIAIYNFCTENNSRKKTIIRNSKHIYALTTNIHFTCTYVHTYNIIKSVLKTISACHISTANNQLIFNVANIFKSKKLCVFIQLLSISYRHVSMCICACMCVCTAGYFVFLLQHFMYLSKLQAEKTQEILSFLLTAGVVNFKSN